MDIDKSKLGRLVCLKVYNQGMLLGTTRFEESTPLEDCIIINEETENGELHKFYYQKKYVRVAELVDAVDSKSTGLNDHEGSNPSPDTKIIY